jgi:hypothetical protein
MSANFQCPMVRLPFKTLHHCRHPGTAAKCQLRTHALQQSWGDLWASLPTKRCAVERIGDDPLLSEPAVVDLFPGAVGTNGCKSSIELGDDLRALALRHAERKRLLVEHDLGDGELVRI